MERERFGTHNRPHYESAHKDEFKRRRTSTPIPINTAVEPESPADVRTGQPLQSKQERLRLVVGAAGQKLASTTRRTAQSEGVYRRKRKRQKRVTPRFFAFVACVMFIFLVFSYATAFWRIREVEQRILTVKSRMTAVSARNEQLRNELERVTSDAYIEEVAREELGLVKPGETAWVIMTPGTSNSPFRVEERQTSRLSADEGW
ncbi:MAG TPA: septum formation initiator family protein [Firmicutes bacterium]|nr:septum formation initiator family protein [Bacillota bacterium]